MDAKITLSFDAETIQKAKIYADKNNISVSRLVEYFFNKITDEDAKTLEAYPIADWVYELMGNKMSYNTKKPTTYLDQYYESKYIPESIVNENMEGYGSSKKKSK
jgi:Family of unknown function (DUF6364)